MSFDASDFPSVILLGPILCIWPQHGWGLCFLCVSCCAVACVALGGWWVLATIQDCLRVDPCGCHIVRQA